MEGGSANDYARERGSGQWLDLDGRCQSKSGNWFKRRSCNVVNTGRKAVNAGVATGGIGPTQVGIVYTYASGGSCRSRQTLVESTGARYPGAAQAFTMGDTIISRERLSGSVFEHERRHSYQYGALGGWGLIPAYGVAYGAQGRCNVFEGSAGFNRGDYADC